MITITSDQLKDVFWLIVIAVITGLFIKDTVEFLLSKFIQLFKETFSEYTKKGIEDRGK